MVEVSREEVLLMESVFIRLPVELKEALRVEAQRFGVSLNAFVLQLFWHWYQS